MIAGPFRRLVAVLRRGDVLPGDAVRSAAAVGTTRANLREFVDEVPGLRAELVDRSRTAALIVCWVAVLCMPAWTVVDRIAVPWQASVFLGVRLLGDVPMLVALYALCKRPVGRSHPEALAFLVMAVVQLEIAWMIPRTHGQAYYLLGFTIAIYGSGCILVARPRWTVALLGVSWSALAVNVLVSPGAMRVADLVAVTVYLGTASIIAVLAHERRYALNDRELLTRVRLEREQQRTRVLLTQLERLSHEDPLTGLANRRRWDAELDSACTQARATNSVLAVVLLDVDHFKSINDRHGHAGGDEALRQVAALLTDRVRADDVVARLGGDELAVLLRGSDLDRAVELAERLCREAAQLVPTGFTAGEVHLSLGVAAARGDEAFPLELMSGADAQLYRAKITRNAVAAPQREGSPIPAPR